MEFEHQQLDQGCSCPRGSRCQLPADSLEVKKHVYKRWQQREQMLRLRPPLGLCPANSPLQFVASGIEIEPMQATIVVGLASTSSARTSVSFWDDDVKMTFMSGRGLGVLSLMPGLNVDVDGNNTKEMTLSLISDRGGELDAVLKGVVYQSTVAVYDDWDTINVKLFENVLNIHVRIRRKPLPYLYKTSSLSPPIHERVTIIIKTFERYDNLKRLIDSVTKFYPAATMIVADDSVHFERVNKNNVLQYKMPPKTGWFAGRNLLVSQVMTEYLVWADDDFVFDENTKLELFMEKLDRLELGLDLVSGYVGDRRTCLQVGRDKEGPCVTVNRTCNRGPLLGYPQCVRVDRALNFFMARTRSVQEIGFDPQFNHIGHTEFFMDGYHSLRCACCSDLSVGHVRDTVVPYIAAIETLVVVCWKTIKVTFLSNIAQNAVNTSNISTSV